MTDASPVAPFLAVATGPIDLEDWGELEEATGPPMKTSGLTLWESGDGAESGVWECTPGPSRWKLETNEFVHILAGRMTCTADGDKPMEVVPGSTVLFPKGWSGTWEIHETIRKLFVVF